jgi:DNA invertase Pin-like site-specific DNA recombinase
MFRTRTAGSKHLLETVYIDDFTRAGRATIEWWRLAALVKRCKKRLIGASDGFDLSNENSDILITMFGLVSRLFIKQLQVKVRRGMRGAVRRGTVLGKRTEASAYVRALMARSVWPRSKTLSVDISGLPDRHNKTR